MRFVTEKDLRFFYNINNELINDVIETEVTIFKVSIANSDTKDIYGESVNKKYYTGIRINCLIKSDTPLISVNEFGQNVKQGIIVAINREMMRQKGSYPEIGDVIEWQETIYEINNVQEDQKIAKRPGEEHTWSFICLAHLSNISLTNLSERIQ